jgi:uncharacterized membrane protein YhaH (DUF805 family)
VDIRHCLRLWFGVSLPVSRRAYLVSGLGLAAGKYLCEMAVIWMLTGLWLSPVDFLNPSLAARREILAAGPEWLGWTLFAWNLPFVWVALTMSVRRAAGAGQSPWLGLLVLVPVVGLLVMVALGVVADRMPPAMDLSADSEPVTEPAAQSWSQWLTALLAGLAVGVVMLGVCVYLIESYAAALFLGTPLVMGAVTGFLFNRPERKSLMATVRVGVVLVLLAAGVLLGFALEGAICIAMAAPIVAPLAVAGVVLGKAVADTTATKGHSLLPLVAALPMMAGAESLVQQTPMHCVLTTVEVDAPPEDVWHYVVAFPDLADPEEWFFRCGIACPLRARIEGTGVGAVRHCEFTTGDFVEPVTVWEEPTRLAFDVTSQPDPMVELSPWRHVHPPHLEEQSLRSHRGEFRLVPLAGGRTRLEGRTWYTFDMHPQGYWKLWSDLAIHAIHRRVLEHVRQLAENEPPRRRVAATIVGAANQDRVDHAGRNPEGATVAVVETHHCDACGRGWELPLADGKSVAVVGKAICRDCYRKADHRWQNIDRHRYATFADGTLVDFKHFRASMLVSQVTGFDAGRAWRGIACANLAGWGVEWTQVAQGHVGGQPFGGNEDLYSNLMGSLHGQLARFGQQTADWTVRALGLLERFHGPLRCVSDTK